MITDICPSDLLLQRIGRLHRHNRNRPKLLQKPECAVLTDIETFEKAGFIYADFLLKKTDSVLGDNIVLPRDISVLVNAVYSDGEDFAEEREAWEQKNATKISNARSFLLGNIEEDDEEYYNLKDWMNIIITSDAAGEASVRDGNNSIEVILIYKKEDLNYYTVDGTFISDGRIPSDDICKLVATQTVKLPIYHQTAEYIKELENQSSKEFTSWINASRWLNGQLILAIHPDGGYLLHNFVKYTDEMGLTYE
jgi:CRISPR-associated endonuclease/helicase Cas3